MIEAFIGANFVPLMFAGLLLLFYIFILLARKPMRLSGTRLATLAIVGFFLSIGLITLPDNTRHWQPMQAQVQETAK